MAHRDVKPENFVLLDDLSLCLIDLGFSCAITDTCTDRKGTQLYYPNEILEESPEYKAHSLDIFQLGVTLFIIMFGTMPWDKSDYSCPMYTALVGHLLQPRDLNAYFTMRPDVARHSRQQWWHIITACLGSKPEDRPHIGTISETMWVQQAPSSLSRRGIEHYSSVC